ncbi:hypothetical protein HanXRQr2_Chr10g0440441 [Helianthus annuus]|uniref:Uncharacterized protein n=1 Tax=Helianthus annuus TaxID=4232 RepID=A0A9K3N4G0_HELAN|nr:hypothetical protein HanXRQr2_Chr10g0440441 [Helianthus annuus]
MNILIRNIQMYRCCPSLVCGFKMVQDCSCHLCFGQGSSGSAQSGWSCG